MRTWIYSLVIIFGFIIDLFLGDPYTLPHPIRAVGRLINSFEKLVRAKFPDRLRFGGILLALCVPFITAAAVFLPLFICYRINLWVGIAAESIMCYYFIAPRCLRDESMKVYRALKENDVEKARSAVAMIVGRDTDKLDESGIARAAVETVAENTSDGVTAPLMYMSLGGAPLAAFYKAVNTMDSMIGYKNEKYAQLGRAAAKLDDILNYLPSRLTALIMIFSSFLLKLDGKKAYSIWRRDRRKHESPNSAQTESVCAGALDIRLAGDAYYFGELHKKEYIGDDIRPIEADDILRANRIMYLTSVIFVILCTALRALLMVVIFA